MAKKLYYKIGEACKRLDIQPYVLRYWETEFPMLRPDKSSSGQRVYNAKDLATIGRIKELLYDEGYTIAGAKKKLETGDLGALEGRPSLRAVEPAPKPEAGGKAKETAAADPAPAPKKAPKKKVSKAAAKKAAAADASGDVAKLRKGVVSALEQARGILAVLDSKSARR